MYRKGLLFNALDRLENFGDIGELKDQLEKGKQLFANDKKIIKNLEEENDKLETENNLLKSMFGEILSAEDKKEVIKEQLKEREDDLSIDYVKLIKEEARDIMRRELNHEEYY